MSAGDFSVQEVSGFVKRLTCRCDGELVLFVGGEVFHLVCHHAVFDNAVGGFDEAVFIDSCICRKAGNKTDVRSFGSLDGAYSAVMGIVNVSYLEGGSVSRQTAGTERGQTALMRKLGKGIRLIHKLAQRRRAEEVTYCGNDGADIDERLRSHGLDILRGHLFLDYFIHSRKADPELVHEQFAHGTQTAVAEMVDIVNGTDAVRKADEIVDG